MTKTKAMFGIVAFVLLVKGAWYFIAIPWLSLIFGVVGAVLLQIMVWELEDYIEEDYLSDGRKIKECDKVRN